MTTLLAPVVTEHEHNLVWLDDHVTLATDSWAGEEYLGVAYTRLVHVDSIDVDDLPESVRDEFLSELDTWKDAVSHEWACRDAYADSRGSF